MTSKQIDRTLKMIRRRGSITFGQLSQHCDRIGASESGLQGLVVRTYAGLDSDGFVIGTPDDPVHVSDAGLDRLADKRAANADKRWTRGLAIAAIAISVLALSVSVLSNLDAVTSAWNSLVVTHPATAEEPHSPAARDTIP